MFSIGVLVPDIKYTIVMLINVEDPVQIMNHAKKDFPNLYRTTHIAKEILSDTPIKERRKLTVGWFHTIPKHYYFGKDI